MRKMAFGCARGSREVVGVDPICLYGKLNDPALIDK